MIFFNTPIFGHLKIVTFNLFNFHLISILNTFTMYQSTDNRE